MALFGLKSSIPEEQHEHNRPFFAALLFEKDGDLNLTWMFVLLMGMIGAIGFMYTLVTPTMTLFDRLAAWSFLGGSFMGVLISAIPLAKAKVLAKSTLPSDFAKSIASVAPKSVDQSTDVQEIITKHGRISTETPPDERG